MLLDAIADASLPVRPMAGRIVVPFLFNARQKCPVRKNSL
jgi:hypothetical protein